MNENYTDEVKAIIEAAQQQALMNYNQEVTSAHLLLALCSDDFFKFLLQTTLPGSTASYCTKQDRAT